MRISPHVFLVGGGPTLGFGLSDDPDCHVYVIDGGDELALIDSGMAAGRSLDRIAANIAAEGLNPDRLRSLLLTHYHMDHAGGAAHFKQRFGLRVLAPRGAADALRTGDERAVALDKAKAAGFYAADYRFEPVEVDQELADGDCVRVGGLTLKVIETPGHCDGHASYLLSTPERRYLFAGDAVFADGKVVLQNIHDCSIQKSAVSIGRLASLEFESLLPGHGPITLDGGCRHVELAAAACELLSIPKNLV